MSQAGANSNGKERANNIKDACALSVDARNLIGNMYAEWKREEKKPKDFEAFLLGSGYRASRRTLNSWNRAIVEGREPVIISKNVGRPRLLDKQKEEIVVGHVLDKNGRGMQVFEQGVRGFVRDRLRRKISADTTRRILAGNGISLHKCRPEKDVPTVELGEIYRKWIMDQRKAGTLKLRRSLIGSLDFTYTNHRTTQFRTFAQVGVFWIFLFS